MQYEKLPIGSKRLKQLLTLTQSLKRNDLIPDSITYGVENEPVLTYGTVKVSMGSLEFLTQKMERLAKIKPQLQGMEGTLHLENWTEETTNIVFDKTESSKKIIKNHNFRLIICMKKLYYSLYGVRMKHFLCFTVPQGYRKEEEEPCWRFGQQRQIRVPKLS